MVLVPAISIVTLLLFQYASAATQQDKDESAKSIAHTTLDLEKCFRDDGNQFFSAFSLSAAMAMLNAGAKGNTASQITKAMHFENFSVRDAQKFYAEIYTTASDKYTLDIVNRLFVQIGFQILQTYTTELNDYFLAPMQFVDYNSKPIEAAQTINEFVKNATRGMIGTVFPPDIFQGSSTVLVIANVIYFKGFWVYKFNTSLTQADIFTKVDGQNVTTMFMNQQGDIRYTENFELDYQAIQLDYEGNAISMTIILPNKHDGLPKLLNTVTASDLQQFSNKTNYRTTTVEVKIPKFKFETTYDGNLVKCLNDKGIVDVFLRDKSDLTGIAVTDPRLIVGKIIHKAVIEVDEEGTKAAAVTVIQVCRSALGCTSIRVTPQFHATRPFFFFISDSRTNAILFSGTFMKP